MQDFRPNFAMRMIERVVRRLELAEFDFNCWAALRKRAAIWPFKCWDHALTRRALDATDTSPS